MIPNRILTYFSRLCYQLNVARWCTGKRWLCNLTNILNIGVEHDNFVHGPFTLHKDRYMSWDWYNKNNGSLPMSLSRIMYHVLEPFDFNPGCLDMKFSHETARICFILNLICSDTFFQITMKCSAEITQIIGCYFVQVQS